MVEKARPRHVDFAVCYIYNIVYSLKQGLTICYYGLESSLPDDRIALTQKRRIFAQRTSNQQNVLSLIEQRSLRLY